MFSFLFKYLGSLFVRFDWKLSMIGSGNGLKQNSFLLKLECYSSENLLKSISDKMLISPAKSLP